MSPISKMHFNTDCKYWDRNSVNYKESTEVVYAHTHCFQDAIGKVLDNSSKLPFPMKGWTSSSFEVPPNLVFFFIILYTILNL